jgi:tetratricopeptide (TPR) repeat protein
MLARATLHGRIKAYEKAVATLDAIAAQRGDGSLSPVEWTEKGQLFDKMGRFDEAFIAFSEGKRVLREMSGQTYLAEPAAGLVQRLKKLVEEAKYTFITERYAPQRELLIEILRRFDRLYREQVAPPPRARGGLAENARNWLRSKLRDVFRRHHILSRVRENVRVEEFTHPGDTFKFDYGYRNGAEGYVQSVLLARDMLQSKALTYTAEHIRKRKPAAEFAAITDTEPVPGNLRHEFLLRLFEEQHIRVVPMANVERFAEELRVRLQ